jgi:hypothetical protein
MLAGIINNTPVKVFQKGINANDVCDHAGKAVRAGPKSGTQMSRENICKPSFFVVSLSNRSQ